MIDNENVIADFSGVSMPSNGLASINGNSEGSLLGEVFRKILESQAKLETVANNGNTLPPDLDKNPLLEHRTLSGGSDLVVVGSEPTDESIYAFAAMQGIDPRVTALVMNNNSSEERVFDSGLLITARNTEFADRVAIRNKIFSLEGLNSHNFTDVLKVDDTSISKEKTMATQDKLAPGLVEKTLLGEPSQNQKVKITTKLGLEHMATTQKLASSNFTDVLKVDDTSISKEKTMATQDKLAPGLVEKTLLGEPSQNQKVKITAKLGLEHMATIQKLASGVSYKKTDIINLGSDVEEILAHRDTKNTLKQSFNSGSVLSTDFLVNTIKTQAPELRTDVIMKPLVEAQSSNEQHQLIRRQEQYLDLSRRLAESLGERLSAQISKGAWRIEMDLYPKMLGRIEVHLEMRNGDLEAYFNPSQNVTRDLLQESFSKLKDILSEHGIDSAYVGLGSGKRQDSDDNLTDSSLMDDGRVKNEPESMTDEPSSSSENISIDGLDVQV